jgi:hypothetical protein
MLNLHVGSLQAEIEVLPAPAADGAAQPSSMGASPVIGALLARAELRALVLEILEEEFSQHVRMRG